MADLTKIVQRSQAPHDDLTGLANQMLEQLGRPGLRAVVVMLSTEEKGGMAIGGYEDDDWPRVIVDVAGHLEAFAKTHGMPLTIHIGKGRHVQ